MGHLAIGLEAGLDAAALLFLPLLVLAPRGVAPLASVAGLFAAGLVLCSNRPIWRPGLAVPAVLIGLLLVWGGASAIWAIDPLRSLDQAAALAGIFAAGLALAVAAELISAPHRLTAFLVAGCILGIALATGDLATHGALSKPFSDRFYQDTWLNQASVTLAILLLPVSAVIVERGHRAGGLLFAAVAAATVCALAGTAAKVALAAGLPMAFLCYYWRARAARAAALVSILVIISAPLTFARLERMSDLVATADAVKFSAGHRLLIWSFVGDRIAEHPLAGWGLELVARDPRREGPDRSGRDLAAAPSAQCSSSALARTRRAGCGAVRAAGRLRLARARPRLLAAPVGRSHRRQSGDGLCRLFRHLRHLAGMVARDLMVLAVSDSCDGAGDGRRW